MLKPSVPFRARKSIPLLLAYMCLRRDARHALDVWKQGPAIVAVVCPDVMVVSVRDMLRDMYDAEEIRQEASVRVYKDETVKGEFESHCITYARLVIVTADAKFLPDAIRDIADEVVHIGLPDRRHYRGALACHFGVAPSESDIEVMEQSLFTHFGQAFREGRSLSKSIAMLREKRLHVERKEMLDAVAPQPKSSDNEGPTLADLFGLGEAGEWGRDLAQDLSDWKAGRISWSEVDRGVLLSGAPGTGKTTFASALARTCGAHFLSGSIAKWQSYGHLGDLLKAMRKAFEEARKNTPCILFIDELDSVGDRENFSQDHRNYSMQVVNGLLEQIDGSESREGVVIVGATNRPHEIDGAITRPGRLDRHIEIPLPDAPARTGILRYHLRGSMPGGDLDEVVTRSEGASGATLEQLVRIARRTARRARRDLSVDDLLGALPERHILSPETMYQIAVHEAGHAVVAHLLDFHVEEVAVSNSFPAGSEIGKAGHVAYASDLNFLSPRSRLHRQIVRVLAGHAAECEIFGEPSSGAGGASGTDLHSATIKAAAMEGSLGMGDSYMMLANSTDDALMSMLRIDLDLRRRVDKRLGEAMDEARTLVRRHRAEIVRVAEAVVAAGRIDRGGFLEALEGQPMLRLVAPKT